MKASDFRKKEKPELHKSVKEKREALRQMRFDLASGKIKSIKDMREIKKDIARILTVINTK